MHRGRAAAASLLSRVRETRQLAIFERPALVWPSLAQLGGIVPSRGMATGGSTHEGCYGEAILSHYFLTIPKGPVSLSNGGAINPRLLIGGKPSVETAREVGELWKQRLNTVVMRGQGRFSHELGIHVPSPGGWKGVKAHVESGDRGVSTTLDALVARFFSTFALLGRVYMIDLRLINEEDIHEIFKLPSKDDDEVYPEAEVALSVGVPKECIIGWRDTIGPFCQGPFILNEHYIDPTVMEGDQEFKTKFHHYVQQLDDYVRRAASGLITDTETVRIVGIRADLAACYKAHADKLYEGHDFPALIGVHLAGPPSVPKALEEGLPAERKEDLGREDRPGPRH